MSFSLIDTIAFLCFATCWIGYTNFSRLKAKNTDCISRCLHQHRIHWMNSLLSRDVRVGEAALMANIERNIAFFASSTLLVLAGVLTLFAQVDKLEEVINSIPYASAPNHALVQVKLGVLVGIFVLAFFHFTWAMRQYGFLNVMIGAAPYDSTGRDKALFAYARQMATVGDQAAHAYNYGLRCYYFAMASLCWFWNPHALIIASLLVVYTLYRREFHSRAVKAFIAAQNELEINAKTRGIDYIK
ncbi:DUF599 domain-containing protein [Shewanella sp. WXL01]|uniref:DUF599 domain-containing protein n=1 Tax=Shewanella maritima TaxID=2520507 RepID=A0A411PEY9_9GAMM|nr:MULTISPECIES: DUF599 domain-containing protein [Shewanella]NKF49828.1 DUF599 domain-containing protein [Shewanella sp. WXL01]QBF82103.1 DUF599 domain-containing protein [Shewanella maritima]